MKTLFKVILVLTAIITISCHDDSLYYVDNIPPNVPTNITTETGDELVIIGWEPVYNSDLAGYAVYYSDQYNGKYNLLGTTEKTYFYDYGAANGETYYYAIASYDFDGNESDLSYDVAYDTPRPEGFDQFIYDFRNYPTISGYDFSKYKSDSYDSDNADFFFENDNGVLYLNVWNDTDIQNMGRTTDIYDISVAPTSGWIEAEPGDNVKYVRAIKGNTYVIWTFDNHYAKIRISELYDDGVQFDWAYQTASGNIELKTSHGIGERNHKQGLIVNRNK